MRNLCKFVIILFLFVVFINISHLCRCILMVPFLGFLFEILCLTLDGNSENFEVKVEFEREEN